MDAPLLSYFQDPETSLGVLDLFYGLYVLYGILRGLFRGFVKESASILGTVITLWGAWSLYPSVSARLLANNLLDHEMASRVLAYILLVFLFLAAWRLVTFLLSKLLSGTMPAQIQRPGGAILGGLKAIVILMIILVAARLSQVEVLEEKMIDQSAFGRLVRDHIPLELEVLQTGTSDESGNT
jgi:membrane protein required for colicin V production